MNSISSHPSIKCKVAIQSIHILHPTRKSKYSNYIYSKRYSSTPIFNLYNTWFYYIRLKSMIHLVAYDTKFIAKTICGRRCQFSHLILWFYANHLTSISIDAARMACDRIVGDCSLCCLQNLTGRRSRYNSISSSEGRVGQMKIYKSSGLWPSIHVLWGWVTDFDLAASASADYSQEF